MSYPSRSFEFDQPAADPTRGLTLMIVLVAAVMVTLLTVEALPTLLSDPFVPSPATVLLAPPG